MRKVILASKSKARYQIFSSLGIPFSVHAADIDEKSIRSDDPELQAKEIAWAKAKKVLQNEEGIVVAADTFSVCEGKVLEKPESYEEAEEMLHLLSENRAIDYTGFCYIDTEKGIEVSTTVVTPYVFRKLYDREIKEYIKKFPVLDWAAAFGLIYPYTVSFVASVEGSYTALAYGIPTELLIPLLKKSGFEPKPVR